MEALDLLLDMHAEFLLNRIGKITPQRIERFPLPKILGYLVGISNQIARADWGLSLREKRVLMLAISRIDYTENQIPQEWSGEKLDFGTAIVTVDDYSNFVRCNRHDAFRDLNSATKSLTDKRKIRINLCPRRGRYQDIYFVSSVDYYPNETLVSIKFTPEFLEYITLLTAGGFEGFGYTKYRLLDVQGLGLPGWRLFELLQSYRPGGVKTIPFCVLKLALGRSEQRTSHFVAKTLKPAVADLRQTLVWELHFDFVLSGRKIRRVNFYEGRFLQETPPVSCRKRPPPGAKR